MRPVTATVCTVVEADSAKSPTRAPSQLCSVTERAPPGRAPRFSHTTTRLTLYTPPRSTSQ